MVHKLSTCMCWTFTHTHRRNAELLQIISNSSRHWKLIKSRHFYSITLKITLLYTFYELSLQIVLEIPLSDKEFIMHFLFLQVPYFNSFFTWVMFELTQSSKPLKNTAKCCNCWLNHVFSDQVSQKKPNLSTTANIKARKKITYPTKI